MGALRLIADDDLDPGRLAARMEEMLAGPPPPPVKLNLDGAANTACWIENRLHHT